MIAFQTRHTPLFLRLLTLSLRSSRNRCHRSGLLTGYSDGALPHCSSCFRFGFCIIAFWWNQACHYFLCSVVLWLSPILSLHIYSLGLGNNIIEKNLVCRPLVLLIISFFFGAIFSGRYRFPWIYASFSSCVDDTVPTCCRNLPFMRRTPIPYYCFIGPFLQKSRLFQLLGFSVQLWASDLLAIYLIVTSQ
jgi:hypothetical protein